MTTALEISRVGGLCSATTTTLKPSSSSSHASSGNTSVESVVPSTAAATATALSLSASIAVSSCSASVGGPSVLVNVPDDNDKDAESELGEAFGEHFTDLEVTSEDQVQLGEILEKLANASAAASPDNVGREHDTTLEGDLSCISTASSCMETSTTTISATVNVATLDLNDPESIHHHLTGLNSSMLNAPSASEAREEAENDGTKLSVKRAESPLAAKITPPTAIKDNQSFQESSNKVTAHKSLPTPSSSSPSLIVTPSVQSRGHPTPATATTTISSIASTSASPILPLRLPLTATKSAPPPPSPTPPPATAESTSTLCLPVQQTPTRTVSKGPSFTKINLSTSPLLARRAGLISGAGSKPSPPPQTCPICSKSFSNASALAKHRLTHSEERRYHCTICSKAFKRQDHLNGHLLTHRSTKPFACLAEGCGKSYCDARSLRRHKENHHSAQLLAGQSPSSAAIIDGVGLSGDNAVSVLPVTNVQSSDSSSGSSIMVDSQSGLIQASNSGPTLVKTKGLSPKQYQLIEQLVKESKGSSNSPSIIPSSSMSPTKTITLSSTSSNISLGPSQVKSSSSSRPAKTISLGKSVTGVTKTDASITASTVAAKALAAAQNKAFNLTSLAAIPPPPPGGGNSNIPTPPVQLADKPVECTICQRKFKNIPALNGHMRLHGGYYKKDAEGRRIMPQQANSVVQPSPAPSPVPSSSVESPQTVILPASNTAYQSVESTGNGRLRPLLEEGMKRRRLEEDCKQQAISGINNNAKLSPEAIRVLHQHGPDGTLRSPLDMQPPSKKFMGMSPTPVSCSSIVLNGRSQQQQFSPPMLASPNPSPIQDNPPSSSLSFPSLPAPNTMQLLANLEKSNQEREGKYGGASTPGSTGQQAQCEQAAGASSPKIGEGKSTTGTVIFPTCPVPMKGRNPNNLSQSKTAIYSAPQPRVMNVGMAFGGGGGDSSVPMVNQCSTVVNENNKPALTVISTSSNCGESILAQFNNQLNNLNNNNNNSNFCSMTSAVSDSGANAEESILSATSGLFLPAGQYGGKCLGGEQMAVENASPSSSSGYYGSELHAIDHDSDFSMPFSGHSQPVYHVHQHLKVTKDMDATPHIGPEHQVEIPEVKVEAGEQEGEEREGTLLWHPDAMAGLTEYGMQTYLGLASSALMPGGSGGTEEWALEILHKKEGNVQAALEELMSLPEVKEEDPDSVWSEEEVNAFYSSLVQHHKDFRKISASLGTKSIRACVEFYYLWKNVCHDESQSFKAMFAAAAPAANPVTGQQQQLQQHMLLSSSSPGDSKMLSCSASLDRSAELNGSVSPRVMM